LYTGDIHRCGITEQYLTKLLFENGFGNLKWKHSEKTVPNLDVIATKIDHQDWSIT